MWRIWWRTWQESKRTKTLFQNFLIRTSVKPRKKHILSTWKPITSVLQDLDKDQSHYLTASKTYANQIWLVSACIKLIMGLWFHFISARNYESFFYYPELVAIGNNRLLPANLPDNWHWPSVKRLSFSMKIFVGSARKRAAWIGPNPEAYRALELGTCTWYLQMRPPPCHPTF